MKKDNFSMRKWDLGAFNNLVDKREWVGGLRFAIFVHDQWIKTAHGGRLAVKKGQNYVHVVIEYPYVLALIEGSVQIKSIEEVCVTCALFLSPLSRKNIGNFLYKFPTQLSGIFIFQQIGLRNMMVWYLINR